jgi:hypothetical protein
VAPPHLLLLLLLLLLLQVLSPVDILEAACPEATSL